MNVNHLLKQTCTVSTAGAQDRFGKSTYGSPTTYACRFQKTKRTITTPQQEREPIDGLVWLKADATAAVHDKLIFGGADFRIMRVEPMVDGKGITRHLELLVQDWSTT